LYERAGSSAVEKKKKLEIAGGQQKKEERALLQLSKFHCRKGAFLSTKKRRKRESYHRSRTDPRMKGEKKRAAWGGEKKSIKTYKSI